MKNFIFFILLVIGLTSSCEKSSLEKPTAVILEITCGGTVIKFTSVEFGEEWTNNFDDGSSYKNVALTEDLMVKGYKEGDKIDFYYKEVNQLDGNFCEIGGLPNVKVKLTDIKIKR